MPLFFRLLERYIPEIQCSRISSFSGSGVPQPNHFRLHDPCARGSKQTLLEVREGDFTSKKKWGWKTGCGHFESCVNSCPHAGSRFSHVSRVQYKKNLWASSTAQARPSLLQAPSLGRLRELWFGRLKMRDRSCSLPSPHARAREAVCSHNSTSSSGPTTGWTIRLYFICSHEDPPVRYAGRPIQPSSPLVPRYWCRVSS